MRRLGYAILFVDDLERSTGFYRDVLDIPVKVRGDGYNEFATEGARFGLYERARLGELIGPGAGGPSRGSPDAEVVFVVEDVDAWADRLRDAGVEILTGPVDRPWGHRTVHVLDPDGHVIELAQEIPRQT